MPEYWTREEPKDEQKAKPAKGEPKPVEEKDDE